MDDTARIVICEDSPTYAAALGQFLEHDPDLRVVARCATAEDLLKRLPGLRADLVTMDLELPGMSGIEAVRRIVRTHSLPVIALSNHTPRGSRLAASALGAGALEAHAKDDLRLNRVNGAAAVAFRRQVKRLARARVDGRRRRSSGPSGAARRRALVHAANASVIAICASTGGPAALRNVLSRLPATFPLPVLVVQHMTSGFTESFARWLAGSVAVPVALAVDGERAGPGVWVAPDGAHLLLEAGMRLRLDATIAAGPHRPAADPLLRSIAASEGAGSTAVVLTGMGRDGGEGTGAVRAAGGLTIAQDEGTSAVYGMARAAAEHGAELVLPVDEIGEVLVALASRRST